VRLVQQVLAGEVQIRADFNLQQRHYTPVGELAGLPGLLLFQLQAAFIMQPFKLDKLQHLQKWV
jgi:hypothetical protein